MAKKEKKGSKHNPGTPKNDASTAKTGAMQNGASTGTQDMDIDAFLEGGFESLSDRPELEAEVGRPKRAAVTTGAVDKQAKLLAQDKKGKKSKKRGNKGQKTASGKIEQLDNEEEQQAADMHPKTGGVKASGPGAVQRELKSHKEELEALKQADPSFYEYLQQSDKGLLEFDSEDEDGLDAAADSDDDDDMSEGEGGHESDGDAVEEGVDSDEEPAVKPSKAKAAKPAQKEKRQQPDVSAKAEQPRGYIDTVSIKRWCDGAKKDASLGAVKRVIQLFRTACHYGDPAKNDDDSSMRIASDSAFQQILVFTLTEADGFFRKLLSLEEDSCAHLPASTFQTAKWRKVGPLIKSYVGNALHLLTHLAEEHSSAFILRRLRASTPFLQPLDALQKKLLKLVAGLFGSSRSRRVRLQALLWLRDFGLTGGPKALPAVLTASYRAYVANARIVTPASVPDLAFMLSGIVELYGLDLEASYEAMFGFVSQLAGILRAAMTAKTAEAYKQAYNWRTVNCLELWGRVVAAHATQGELQPLVYPVVQLLLAAARLVASPRWFPIRLRLARILTAVASATRQFVPIVPLLLEVLTWPGFSKPVSGVGKCPVLSLQLRLSKANLSSPAVQQAIVEQTMEILAGALALHARSPAFPDLSHLPVLSLRRFIKSATVEKFRTQATLLVHAVESQAKLVGMERDGVDFAPKDLATVSNFLKDKADNAMPLIKFARKLAETASENRNAAELEAQVVDMQEGEPEQDEAPDLLVMPNESHEADDVVGQESDSRDKMEEDDDGEMEEDKVDAFVLSDDEGAAAGEALTDLSHKKSPAHSRQPDRGGRKKGFAPGNRSGKNASKNPLGPMSRIEKFTAKASTSMRRAQGKAKSRKNKSV